jgi:hypothetical protein
VCYFLIRGSASLSGAKIFGEVRVNLTVIFKNTELPEALEVRAKPHKFLSQVIQHVLQKLQGKIISLSRWVNSNSSKISIFLIKIGAKFQL